MKNILFLLLFLTNIFAGTTIVGKIVDDSDNSPIPDANIEIFIQDSDQYFGRSSDFNGKFTFNDLPGKKALIKVTVIGYEEASIEVLLKNGFVQPIDFRLKKQSISFEEVQVYSSFRKINEGDLTSSARIFNEELEIKKGQHFGDLIQNVPNLNYAGGTSRPKYFQIRGEGSTSRYADQGPPSTYVGLVLDGMDLSELGIITPLFDMQQIEVLMGVQTSLFGANASSGLINFKTNNPSEIREGYFMTQYGSYNTLMNGFVYNTPLKNDWRIRFVGYSNRSDGFKNNSFLNSKTTAKKDESSFRTKIMKSKNNLSQKYTFIISDFDNGYDNWSPDNNISNITYSDNPGKDSQKSSIIIADYLWNVDGYIIDLNLGASSNSTLHSYDSDWGNINFWSEIPYNFNPVIEGYNYDFFDSINREIDTKSADLRWKSDHLLKNNKVDFVFGLFSSMYNETNIADGYIFGGSATNLSSSYKILTQSIYGDVIYNINDDMSLSLALRSEQRDIDYIDNDQPLSNFKINGKNNLSYKLSLESHPANNFHWFTYFAEGYHPAGINQNPYLDEDEKVYDKETYRDITAGIRWINDTWKLSTSIFHLSHKNHIYETSEQLDPLNPNAFAFFKTNADSGYEYGLESTGEFKISDRFSMKSSLGLMSSEIELSHHEEEHEDHNEHEEDQHGEHGKKAHAPNWNYSISFKFSPNQKNALVVEVSGKDSFIFDSNHDEYQSEPYHILNSYYSRKIDKIEIGLYAKNILNESFAERGFIFGLEPPFYEEKLYTSYGPPRELGMSLTYSF
jgi:iron complex outermembrane receptor protein